MQLSHPGTDSVPCVIASPFGRNLIHGGVSGAAGPDGVGEAAVGAQREGEGGAAGARGGGAGAPAAAV